MNFTDRIIVALDRPSLEENLELVRLLEGRSAWYKVGMRQFYAGAEPLFAAIQAQGASLFLDLKLHDIPATVEGAAASLARLKPALATVHAGGGREMIAAAARGFRDAGSSDTRILAVTVLTSLDRSDLAELKMVPPGELVALLGRVAMGAGADGLVSSPHEVSALREAFPEALLVTPGVRLVSGPTHDQKRVATPAAALAAGADYLVVGRAIHHSEDPVAAFDRIVQAASEPQ